MTVHTHHGTPAHKIERALELLVEAMQQMQRRGVEQSATADMAIAVMRVSNEFKRLPRVIADGRNALCKECEYSTTEIDIMHGVGQAARQWPACAASDALVCPCVKAAGFLTEADLREQVPSFLRRQAD